MTRTLNAFPAEFWNTPLSPVAYSGKPTSVQQALFEMSDEDWFRMVGALFDGYAASDLSMDDVLTLIRETNTCEGLDSELSVWVDEAGDFKIKVCYGS